MGLLSSKVPPLQTVPTCQTNSCMGTWFVIAVKPTPFETTCSNAVERYVRVTHSTTSSTKKTHDIDIDFQYNKKDPISSTLKSLPQRGWVQGNDVENSGEWKVSPFGFIRLSYPIIELDDVNYEYCVVGSQGRSYVWIMARKPVMEDKTYAMLTNRLVQQHGYTLDGLRRVPQVWTRAERLKRGLVDEIPDELLVQATTTTTTTTA